MWFLNRNFILILAVFAIAFLIIFYANNLEISNKRQYFDLEKQKLTPKDVISFNYDGLKVDCGGGGLGKLNFGDLFSLGKTNVILNNNVHIYNKSFNIYTRELEYNPFEKKGQTNGEVLVEGKDFFFSGRDAKLEKTTTGFILDIQDIDGVALGSPISASKISYNINTKQLSAENSVVHIWKIPIMWLPNVSIELN